MLAGMPSVVRARGPALTRSIYLPLQDTTIQTHTTPTPPPPPPRTARSLPRRNLKAARARAVPRWGLRATTHTPPSQRARPDSKPPPRRFLIKLKGQELRCGWVPTRAHSTRSLNPAPTLPNKAERARVAPRLGTYGLGQVAARSSNDVNSIKLKASAVLRLVLR